MRCLRWWFWSSVMFSLWVFGPYHSHGIFMQPDVFVCITSAVSVTPLPRVLLPNNTFLPPNTSPDLLSRCHYRVLSSHTPFPHIHWYYSGFDRCLSRPISWLLVTLEVYDRALKSRPQRSGVAAGFKTSMARYLIGDELIKQLVSGVSPACLEWKPAATLTLCGWDWIP